MKIKNELPIATFLTATLFIFVYVFKAGEAYFFGYPQYYIYLDTSEVINTALKLLVFFLFIVSLAYVTQLNKKTFIVLLTILCLYKIVKMIILYKEGGLTIQNGINTSTTYTLTLLLIYFAPRSFSYESNTIKIRIEKFIESLAIALILCFFIGWNYHSFMPESIWQTEDNKVVVGRYQDKFILRQCMSGKPYFYLEDVGSNVYEMFYINTSGTLLLRCQTELDAMKK